MKQLGIIIPAYNVGYCLEDLLNTLVKQMTDAVEVVIIDDGSQDNTLTVAKRFVDENITVIQQENQGVGAARNRGIETCSAEYLWFVDADDNIRSNAICTLLDTIRQMPSDCYLFGFDKIRGKEVTQIANPSELQLTSSSAIAQNFDTVFSENLLNPLWNKVFRSSIIQQHQIRFSSIPSGEDAEFVLHYLSHANSMHIMPTVLYQYTLMSDTSSAHTYHPEYVADHEQMFKALAEYCAATGANVNNVTERWRRETYLGACMNVFNGLLPKPTYKKYHSQMNEQAPYLQKMLSVLPSGSRRKGLKNKISTAGLIVYLYMRLKLSINRMHCFFSEIAGNAGLLPKIVVIIYRFGNWAYNIQIKPIKYIFYLLYRIVDLLLCKMLLNCDIPGATSIGYGFTIYHPYGVIINSDAVIGRNFTCRAQIVVGNKGTKTNDGSPIIGNNVTLGAGAKVIGPITIGDNCSIGANSVVTHSFPANRILVGVPAKALERG